MSDLILDIKSNLGLNPEVVGYLASIKENEYFYKYYKLRHPGGIFNIAFGTVVDDFLELLIELEDCQENYSKNNEYRKIFLEKKFKDLINDFFKFRDSLDEIILACCKKDVPPTGKQPIYQWLNTKGYTAGKDIHDEVDKELDYFNRMHNKLKHSSNTIERVYFYNKDSAIMGFYITGVTDNGIICPNEEFHPKFNGLYSGSSYNFTLKNLYYLLYKTSSLFSDVLIRHFKKTYNIDLEFNSDKQHRDTKIRELFYRMRNLPNLYFGNEYGQITHEFKLEQNRFFLLEKPAEANYIKYRVSPELKPDGYARSFALPYYRG